MVSDVAASFGPAALRSGWGAPVKEAKIKE
jgi:hypothetical protein